MLSDMIDENFKVHQALKHTQNDIKMSLKWANTMDQSCPITASLNEVLKHAMRLGNGHCDSTAVDMNT